MSREATASKGLVQRASKRLGKNSKMAPDPGGRENTEYTVACAAKKAIPDADHLTVIRDAVLRVHNCTMAATELLNLYVRDRIENHGGAGLTDIFKQNWLLNAYHEVKVSNASRKPKGDEALHTIFNTYMKDTDRPNGQGLTQTLTYECINLAAVGSTNVWMHFQKRVLAFTRTHFALTEEAYKQLSADQRRARKLAVLQAAEDVGRNPSNPRRSPAEYHAWVDSTRARLGIDAAVGEWGDKPLLYHLKVHPERFLVAMHLMSTAMVDDGRKAFALFPLRRSNVPRHIRFDKAVLDDLLCLGAEYARAKTKPKPDLNATQSGRAPKRKRDDPTLVEEKAEVFNQVLDLRAAGVHRRHQFAFAFTTDGYSVHLNMHVPGKHEKTGKTSKTGKAAKATTATTATKLASMPTRGIHSIDTLKALAKKHEVHTIGIDPGKRELIVAVDTDDPQHAPVVRYTLAQRRRDLRTRQYLAECLQSKPQPVAVVEEELSLLNSKAPSLAAFAAFAARRRQLLRDCPSMTEFYTEEAHRNRRRKTKRELRY